MLGKIEGKRRRGRKRMRWLDGITGSLENTLMVGKIEGRRRRGRQRMRWLDGIIDSMDMSFEQILGDSEGLGSLACFCPWVCKVLERILATSCKELTHWKRL